MNSAAVPHSQAAAPFGYSFPQNDSNSISQPSIAPPTSQARTSGSTLLNNQEEDYINSFFMSHTGPDMSRTNGFDMGLQQVADQLHGGDMTQFGWLMNEQPPTFVDASANTKQMPAPAPCQQMAHHASLDFGTNFGNGNDMLSNQHYQNMLAQASFMQNVNMGHGQMHPPQHTPSLVSAPSTEASDMLHTADAFSGPPTSAHALMNLIPGTTVTTHEIRDILGSTLIPTFGGLTPLDTVHDGRMEGPYTAPARLDDTSDAARYYRFGSDSHFALDGFKPSSVNEQHEVVANRLTAELHRLQEINRSGAPSRVPSPDHHLSSLHTVHHTNHMRAPSAPHLHTAVPTKEEFGNTDHIPKAKKRRREEAVSDDEDDTSPATKRKISMPNPRLRRVSSTATENMTPSGASKRRRSSLTGSASKQSRENLSEEQKRSNHIHSEQKRRNLIKNGFDELRRLVPELRAGGLSKSMELNEVSNFLEQVIHANKLMRARLGIPEPTNPKPG